MNYQQYIEEVWLPYIIDGESTLYMVSNHGRCKSLWTGEWKIIKPKRHTEGYLQFAFHFNGEVYTELAHRVVGIYFIPNPENLPIINHLDGNKKNNYVDNLVWDTDSGNKIHAYQTGLKTNKKYGDSLLSKRVGKYFAGILLKEYGSFTETVKDGYIHQNVYRAAKNGSTHRGFSWKYLD